jgi:hypothetical protein
MKRNIIAAVLGAAGLVGLAASSYGQGEVNFDTYSSIGYFPVTYSTSAETALSLPNIGAGQNVDAELGYFIGTYSVNSSFTLIPSTITAPSTDIAPIDGTGPSVAGYIRDGAVAGGIPGYSSGPISFEILAWVASGAGAGGGTYATSLYNGLYKWTETSLPDTGSSPATFFQSLGGNAVLTAVPEPTTLALAGLGGAALLALRRKKA